MNQGQINGYSLNGPASGGSNATLSGGFATTSALSALLVAGAILVGGLESSPDAGGRVSKSLDGGVYSTSISGGILFKTANLQQGIFSDGGVGSNIGLSDGLTGGVESMAAIGGQIIAGARLKVSDTVGDTSLVGGVVGYSAGLTGGIESTSYASGNMVGSVVLFGDGVRSSSTLGGLIGNGRILSNGAESFSEIGGRWFYGAILSGGLFSLSDVLQGMSLSAKLQDGMISVGVAGSPAMRISAELDDGLGSNTEFNAQIIVSPNSNYGVDSGSSVGGMHRVGAVLTGGAVCISVIDSVALRAAQRLQGGLSSSGSASAGRMISCAMNGALSSDAALSASLVSGARLHSYVFADTSLDGGLRIGARLSGHIESSGATGSTLTVFNNFTGGVPSDAQFHAGLIVIPVLTDGVSSNALVDGDIVQGFRDPLLNTWALDIRSATQILEIETPSQDS